MAWTTKKLGGYIVKYLRQKGSYSCAPTCVAMLLANLSGFKANDELEEHTRSVAFSQVMAVKKKYGGEGSKDVSFAKAGMTVDQVGRLLGCYHLDGIYYCGQGTAIGINQMGNGEAALFASDSHVVLLIRKKKGLILLDPRQEENSGFKKGAQPAEAAGPGCYVGDGNFGWGGCHVWRIRCPSRAKY